MKTYEITPDGASIICLHCGARSYHPEDIKQLYCGKCHQFHEAIVPVGSWSRFPEMKDPETPEEWQDAINLANFLLLLDASRQYGLVEGGPEINTDRCIAILERGKLLGYMPKEVQ